MIGGGARGFQTGVVGGGGMGGGAVGGAGAGAGVGACGVSCCGTGGGGMSYAPGCGDYVQETTWRYVGYGGDYCEEKPRDFTCVFACGGLFSVCILVIVLLVILWPSTTTRLECRREDMFQYNDFERNY